MKRTRYRLRVTDVHVGGDVHQIVLGGIGSIPGQTILEQRDFLRDRADDLRRIVLNEPRGGHPSHFADLVLPAKDPSAAAGFVIMEYLGYPLFSGSNTMATAIALVEEGHIPLSDGLHTLMLESPGGLVGVEVELSAAKVISVTFRPDDTASLIASDLSVMVEGRGEVVYDLVWAGCWYAVVSAERYGFDLNRDEEAAQGQFAYELMEALAWLENPRHPVLGDQGRVALVLFAATPTIGSTTDFTRRISPVVYPRSVSRCPAGTGTTAAVAQMVAKGLMSRSQTLEAVSSWGTSFRGDCYHIQPDLGVRVAVSGHGWIICRKEIILDSTDPLTPVATIRKLLSDCF